MNKEFKLSDYEGFVRRVLEEKGEFCIYPGGSSMLPFLRPGMDSVILAKPLSLHKYDIILYKRANGRYVLHRILDIKKDGFVLCGDNQYIKEYGVLERDVIAVVKEIRRGAMILSNNSLRYRIYLFCCCRLFYPRAGVLWIRSKIFAAGKSCFTGMGKRI
ncbi:hypothetical protein HNQ56_002885 [Anaerotaenia torta]|uniref:S24/S26 family peptidase n=1 Tax=Anaerotaenia torta TaxID=433293 RepID=UPI003D24A089